LTEAREEIVEHPSQPSFNGSKPPEPRPGGQIDSAVEGPTVDVPIADTSTRADTSRRTEANESKAKPAHPEPDDAAAG
jgi:hypothetical protein